MELLRDLHAGRTLCMELLRDLHCRRRNAVHVDARPRYGSGAAASASFDGRVVDGVERPLAWLFPDARARFSNCLACLSSGLNAGSVFAFGKVGLCPGAEMAIRAWDLLRLRRFWR